MSEAELSRKFIDVIPRTMRAVRSEIREIARSEFTTPQFRSLAFVARQGFSTNCDLATHVGVSVPSMSRMVDTLIARGLMKRVQAKGDRRKVTIQLTALGDRKYARLRAGARSRFKKRFAALTEGDRAAIARGLDVLDRLFHADEGSRP